MRSRRILGLLLVALGAAGFIGLVPAGVGLAVRRLRPPTGVLAGFAAGFTALAAAGLLGAVNGYGVLDHMTHLALAGGCVVAARRPRRRVARMA